MAMNIHQEARRKQVFMDRVCEARRRMAFSQDDAPQASGSCGGQRDSEKVMCTDQGQFYQTRVTLRPFRVNRDGHNNRYRNRQHLSPHCDRAYTLIYPKKENPEYTEVDARKNRRENSFVDLYEVRKKVNGEFHMQVAAASSSDD
ncbi:uncharacterized protein LOC101850851 isoform X1 [Aplysia californica]|uniref:Uncharacterized protein LOC101850851 isoform X1 n=1 Tax=Aplysia californica TaxID=6500 RepID=A0ABM1ABA5_APLCA|nr:uncharacterized protein LOC101850851 isoform X1 [Aplysia californica]